MVIGFVQTVEDKFTIVDIGKTLALMPKSQQIPSEYYKEGDKIRVLITDVKKDTKGAQVLVSRADAMFVKRLLKRKSRKFSRVSLRSRRSPVKPATVPRSLSIPRMRMLTRSVPASVRRDKGSSPSSKNCRVRRSISSFGATTLAN